MSGMSTSEREALWNTIALVRDSAPRTSDDADTDDIIDAIIDSGWVHALIAKAKAEALREAASFLREQGSMCFDEKGPRDARGSALWDAGCSIDPSDGNALGADRERA